MNITIHAGHNPDGKVACGAIGYLKESTEARKVKDLIYDSLCEVIDIEDATINDGKDAIDVLERICKKCNAKDRDLNISIHFNASRKETVADGKIKGSEIWLHDSNSELKELAESILRNLEMQGYTNRGVKYSNALYVLAKTKSPTMLIECCFVDDLDDVALYDEIEVANAISDSILSWCHSKESLDNLPELMYNESIINTKEEFLQYVAKVAMWDWYRTKRVLPSVVLAQAIKESAWGQSELARNAKALFGIKKNGWTGQTYIKDAVEQNKDGKYHVIDNVEWRKYSNWFESIIDHNHYIATRKIGSQKEPNWNKVIGCKDYVLAVQYLQNAKYPYATSITYEQSLISDYIEKYKLNQFDIVDKALFDVIEKELFEKQIAPDGYSYFIIAGEYKNKHLAEGFSKRLKEMGIINRIELKEESK